MVLGSAAGPETTREPFCFTPLLGVPFVFGPLCALRVLRFAGSDGGGGVSLLTREDFRMPLSNMVVGPSAENSFQGGDMARGALRLGVRSSNLRRFAGRCMAPPCPPFCTPRSSSGFVASAALFWKAAVLRAAADASRAMGASCGGGGLGSAFTSVTSAIQQGAALLLPQTGDHRRERRTDMK